MPELVRYSRHTRWWCLGQCVVYFPFIFLSVALLCGVVLPDEIGHSFIPDRLLGWLLLAAELTLAFLIARRIYLYLRWAHVVEDDESCVRRSCENCGCDLTGNYTGRCPECSQTTAAERPG
jgi:hypothetical protein